MSKFAYGPATWHVLASDGPSVSPYHFYSTTYSTVHGKHSNGGNLAGGNRHKGTGYGSNFRPGVYYSSKLDKIDNPVMGKLLLDNYRSMTKKDYGRYQGPQGSDPLPGRIQPFNSGFAQNQPSTLPTARQAHGVHIDTACEPCLPTYPHQGILLHSLKTRDPIAAESGGHGPKSMSTEYHTRFMKQQFRDADLQGSRHSRKEESGFTHAQNIEPVTFRPHENFGGELPGHMTWRPTGRSLMKKDFNSPLYMKGGEPFQPVTAKADRSNGYVKGNKGMADVQPKASEMVGYTQASQVHSNVLRRVQRENPAEYSIMAHPHQYTSLTQRNFQGRQRSPKSESQRLEREAVGDKELTGFSENNGPVVEPRDRDIARFSTHYQQRFYNPNPQGSAREPVGGAQPPKLNGFTKSTQVHMFGPTLNTARDVRHLNPYCAKSIIKRDPYFVDHTHSAKVHAHM